MWLCCGIVEVGLSRAKWDYLRAKQASPPQELVKLEKNSFKYWADGGQWYGVNISVRQLSSGFVIKKNLPDNEDIIKFMFDPLTGRNPILYVVN